MNVASARLPLPPVPGRGADWALYLDFDGTLCPLAAHPDQVRVDDGLRQLLARLHGALDGAVCILSGRPLRQLQTLLPGLDGLTMVGCHGAEGLGEAPCDDTLHELAVVRRALARGTLALAGV